MAHAISYMIFSFGSCVKKGKTLYDFDNKRKIYLAPVGLRVINLIRNKEGKYIPSSKEEKDFIQLLLSINILKKSRKFNDLVEELPKKPPNIIEWEITRECNLSCSYCFLNFLDKPGKEKEPFEILKKILDVPFLEIYITGGEPLLLKEKLKKIIKILKKNNKGVNVFTNGHLIDDEWVKFFSKYHVGLFLGIDYLQDRSMNKSLTKQKIITMKKKGIDVRFNITLTKKNVSQLSAIKNFSNKHKIPLRYSPVIGYPKIEPAHTCYINLVTSLGDLPNIEHTGCGAGKNSVYIRNDGKVFPCALFLNNNFTAGELSKSSLQSIIKNPRTVLYRKISKFCNKKFPTLELKFCENCFMRFMCNSGCRARAYLNTKKIDGKDKKRCYLEKQILLQKIKNEGLPLVKESLYNDYKEKVTDNFFRKILLKILKHPEKLMKNDYVLLKIIKNKIIGIIFFKVKKRNKMGKISFMTVKKKFRNEGIGSELLKEAETACNLMKAEKMVFGSDKQGLKFYLKNRYKIVGKETSFGNKIYILEKKLKF